MKIAMNWHRQGDYPVDTHVLLYHSRSRKEWLDQTLASLEGEPTNILLVDHPSSSVGLARAFALGEGKAPFLSFVDDDDWVMPGAFQACLDRITDGVVGAYTDFSDVGVETGKVLKKYHKLPWCPRHQQTHPFEVLHVHVFRREPTLKYLNEVAQWPTLEESLLMGLLVQDGDWIKVDFDGYRKRAHRMGAGARITRNLLVQLGNRLGPILLQRHRQLHRTPVQALATTAVQALQRAVASPWGCATCQKTRASVGNAAIRGLTRFMR